MSRPTTVFYRSPNPHVIAPIDLPRNILKAFQPLHETHELPPGASSVLAPLVSTDAGWSLLFTRRTKHMSAFAGHLSFPGGRIDATDKTPLAAALRETHEEIGLSAEHIQVLGHFTQLETHFGTLVLCYGGAILAAHVPTQPTSTREVEEILHVPLDSLRNPGSLAPTDDPAQYVATAYEARRIGSPHAPSRTLHYWTLTNATRSQRTILWGITGELVARFLTAAFDWSPPHPPRLVEQLEELQP